jgi:hypothetical protein
MSATSTYFDLLPEDLIFEIFHILKASSVVLSRVDDRLKTFYNRFILKIKKGYIQPHLTFKSIHGNCDMITGIMNDIYLLINMKIKNKSYDKVGVTFDGVTINVNNYIKYENIALEYTRNCVMYLQENIVTERRGTFLGTGPEPSRYAIYIIVYKPSKGYIYIEIEKSCLNGFFPKGSIRTSTNWKHFWNEILNNTSRTMVGIKNLYLNSFNIINESKMYKYDDFRYVRPYDTI